MTLRAALLWGREQIGGSPDLEANAARDAEVLLLHSLTLERTALYAYPDRRLTDPELATYAAAVERRARAEPIQYITGVQEFFGLPFSVTPAVLIPRPETELLVEAVLDHLPPGPRLIADVGTGSGAIAVAIASRRAEVKVLAIDRSADALAVARRNAMANGVDRQISFHEGDLLLDLPSGWLPLDAVVSNPPYIPLADRPSLERQVREFEPSMALFAEEAGLGIYYRLLPQAWASLRSGALLAVELGIGQRTALLGRTRAWAGVKFLDDVQGIPRTMLAWRS